MDVEEAIQKRFLSREIPDKQLINKEVAEAGKDFSSARLMQRNRNYKWCIIHSYYAMFHAAKAVIFSLGMREKRHFAVGVVLEDLAKKGRLGERYATDFQAALEARGEANYHYKYSAETASYLLEIAEDFIAEMKRLLKTFK